MIKYVAPNFHEEAFTCPYCGVYTTQEWDDLVVSKRSMHGHEGTAISRTTCFNCGEHAFWYEKRMLYPTSGTAPMPHPDLPAELKEDYLEARDIVSRSPRGAAALLRLVIQKLCGELGESGRNNNADIKNLVEKGLDVRVQQALDSVRVIGNDAVHPGELDLRDDPELANALFMLVNEIIDEMIAKPKRIAAVYAKLPQDKRDAIDARDGRRP